MIVANDMSLITFLPLTYIVLHSTRNDKYLAFTFIMQTIVANMGGMITQYGNPQNLYLYSYYNIPTSEFFGILLLQAITVAVLLYICVAFIPNEKLKLKRNAKLIIAKDKLLIYAVLFVLVILGIFRILPCMLILAIVNLTIAITDIKRFKKSGLCFTGNFLRVFCIFREYC